MYSGSCASVQIHGQTVVECPPGTLGVLFQKKQQQENNCKESLLITRDREIINANSVWNYCVGTY